MNYLDVIGTYAPSVVSSAAEGVRKYLKSESSVSSRCSNRTKEVWVDPICAMIALAILQKEPQGTKISFDDNEITFDQPLPFQAQSYIRYHKRSSRKDLYNLTPAIYYSIQWLDVVNNNKYKIILETARKGISKMIHSTYRDDLQLQQYLTTTHLRMLEDGLAEREISREGFMIPDHDENPLNTCSKSYWSSDQLDKLSKQLLEFQERGREDVIKPLLLRKIGEINHRHKDYLQSVCAGRPTNLERDWQDDRIILVEFNNQKGKRREDGSCTDDKLGLKRSDSPSQLSDRDSEEASHQSEEEASRDDFG